MINLEIITPSFSKPTGKANVQNKWAYSSVNLTQNKPLR